MKPLLLWCALVGSPALAQDTGPCDTADTSTPCDTGDSSDTSDCDTADSASDCDTGADTGDTGDCDTADSASDCDTGGDTSDTSDTADSGDSAYTGLTYGAAELAGELGGCGCNTLELPASAAVLCGLALLILRRRRSGNGVLSRV